MVKITSKLSSKKRYLQIAFNNTLKESKEIIFDMPISDRILIEAGTPLIKRYGIEIIKKIKEWYELRLKLKTSFRNITQNSSLTSKINPYIVADLKMMDRGETEVELAASAGADAAVALGCAPIESLNVFIQKCEDLGLDAMVDMMNVKDPLSILRQLKKLPRVVILHRGVDEERFNKEKQIPFHEIRRIKGNYDILVSIAGGDTLKEVQRAIFNDADIVVIWKSVFQKTTETTKLIEDFLKEIK